MNFSLSSIARLKFTAFLRLISFVSVFPASNMGMMLPVYSSTIKHGRMVLKMALTAKPISTISYNSHNFLLGKLQSLFDAGRIEDFRVMFHAGEDGDKDHAHVLIYPNRRLDTVELRNLFNEVDPNNDKPLGVLPFRKSSDLDWLMYVLHDPVYLYSHHSDNDGDGKIVYSLDECITPFPEQLQRDYIRAQSLRRTKNQQIIDCFDRGLSFASTIASLNANPLYVNVIYQNLRSDIRVHSEEKAASAPVFSDISDSSENPFVQSSLDL